MRRTFAVTMAPAVGRMRLASYLVQEPEVIQRLLELAASRQRVVCSIAGESGVGKTTFTEALRTWLDADGYVATVLHQDVVGINDQDALQRAPCFRKHSFL